MTTSGSASRTIRSHRSPSRFSMSTFEIRRRTVRPSTTTSASAVWTEASGVYGKIRQAWYTTATASTASTTHSTVDVSPTRTTRTA